MLNSIRAEWVKMWTIKSTPIAAALTLILSIISGVFIAFVTRSMLRGTGMPDGVPSEAIPLSATQFFMGVTTVGMVIMLVLGVTAVTNEYATSTIESTFRGVPRRWQVFLAKLVTYGGISFLVGLVTSFLTGLIGKLILLGNANVTLFDSTELRAYLVISLGYLMAVMVGMGVAMIFHSTALSISALLIWMWPVETILFIWPNVGPKVGGLLPFQNLQHFMTLDSVGNHMIRWYWENNWSGLYFFGITLVIFLVGLLVSAPDTFQPHKKVTVDSYKQKGAHEI